MINPMNLTDKNIIVTGASSGLGKQTAIFLSKLGAKVFIVARNPEKLQDTLSEMEGTGHKSYPFDLTQIDDIDGLVKTIVKENGALDGLVHCAGIATMRPLKITTYDFVHEMMLINFYSFIELARVYSKKNYNNGGSIVAMSSAASQSGDKTKTAYCASKAAIDGAIKAMSKELAMKNIRINSIVAGFIKTNLYDEYIQCAGHDAMDRAILSRQFLGMGESVDVAGAIAYLLSDISKFVTGTGMVVDGGYLV